MLVTNLPLFQMRNALYAEEESTALSTWAVASLCGCLRLEHVSTHNLRRFCFRVLAQVCVAKILDQVN
jgi:hypothetical protein